jgi:diguanylate cyclase (GGDEF)-like protein
MQYHWSGHQLTEYFAAISAPDDEDGAILVAAERAAEALDAEIGAVVVGGRVRGQVGLGAGADLAILSGAVESPAVTIPGLGTFACASAPLSRDGGAIVVARAGAPIVAAERQVLQGMAQILGLVLRGLRTLAAERALREEREQEAIEREELVQALTAREHLLETLLAIQRAVSQRKPLQEVLDGLTGGAAGLLGNAVVSLVIADPIEAGRLLVAARSAPGHPDDAEVVLGVAAQAMVNGTVATTAPEGGSGRGGCAIAAPVEVDGTISGSLVALVDRDAAAEARALLSAFAQQVSLALTDAHMVQAMRDARRDPLTGLQARAPFVDEVEQAFAEGDADGPLAVLFIDLDGFKDVNDSHGHKVGDELLAAVATRIVGCLRAGDHAGRLGGDEFAALLGGMTADAAARVATRIATALGAPFTIGGRELRIAASVGVADRAGGARDASDLLSNADTAMYAAKRQGPGRVAIFETVMRDTAGAPGLDSALRLAVERDELSLAFQPLYDLDSGRAVAVEALLRWNSPEHGSVPPSAFIPIAERTGQIVEIGRWVLERSAELAALWRRTHPGLTVNVNVSARQVAEGTLGEAVRRALARTGLAADALVLELTENVLMRDHDASLRCLTELKQLGVGLAIDDFGTGYSSLSRLRALPVDVIKVDRSFVPGPGSTRDDSAVLQAIVGLARTLRLETVAEGIETEAQLELARWLGCNLGQGFHLARPVAADAVPALLAGPGRLGAAA